MQYYRRPPIRNERLFFGGPFFGGLLGGLAGGLVGGAFYPRPRPYPVYPPAGYGYGGYGGYYGGYGGYGTPFY